MRLSSPSTKTCKCSYKAYRFPDRMSDRTCEHQERSHPETVE
ncbi:hypothetical protein [Allocoleopsis sp.]